MAHGREYAEWWQTAALAHTVYYTQPRKSSQRLKPADFHPMEKKSGGKVKVSLKELGAAMFGVKT